MVEVEMTKDIREYEPKMFGLFTRRQLICLIIGLVFALPIALLLPVELPVKFMVGAVVMTPFGACGWIKVYDMKLESFMMQAIRTSFLVPVNRKYKIESSVKFLEEPKTPAQSKKIKQSADYPAHK